jgi:hypothetical protein
MKRYLSPDALLIVDRRVLLDSGLSLLRATFGHHARLISSMIGLVGRAVTDATRG